MKKRISPLYRVIKWLIRLCYPTYRVVGAENIPAEPAVFVGNHSQLHGPLACELHFPVKRRTWCAAEMMQWREVPAYAFEDFWSGKPRHTHWFYRLLAYLITPLSVLLFNNADTIGVYHDKRVLSTFRQTVTALAAGEGVVVFPECYIPHNHIVYEFQDRFVDVAKLYHKKSGQEVCFVPLYIAPKLKTLYFGKSIRFCADTPIEQERRRICEELMAAITDIACALPEHTVVPYPNLPKKCYPKNTEVPHEKTDC